MDKILEHINGEPHNDGVIVVADDVVTFVDATTRAVGEYIHPDVSACAVTLASAHDTGTATGNLSGTSKWNSYGPGAVSTERAPLYSQVRSGNNVVSTIYVDLTGLKADNDEGDIIGLAATDGAYIGKYVAATMGVLTKVEVSCVELPTVSGGSGTLLADIDVITATLA